MTPPPRLHRIAFWLLSTLIACRVVILIFLPHTDSSEARYAEIARKMVETGDWITPQFDYGIPFWAKPPLAMWMSALGMEFFGANEFGSRIFIFLTGLAVLALLIQAVRREKGATTGLLAGALLMGMPLYFYCSAAVLTDLALVLGTTLAMVAFRRAIMETSRLWGYLFFAALGIGLLAKGPLTLVLALPPAIGWAVLTGQIRKSLRSLPWFGGLLLMLLIALPWYLAAENRTPGFLEYFIVGEHWKRFMVRGWEGDLYGNAHSETPGTIWVYLLMVTFPWCLGLLALPFRKWRAARSWAMADEGWGIYWLLWALWPLVFFTPARNIIATYTLPALPPLAVLLAALTVRATGEQQGRWQLHPFHPALIGLCLALVGYQLALSVLAPERLPKSSERELIARFQRERHADDRLLYFGIRRYSAEFYSGGEAEHTKSVAQLVERLDHPCRLFVAMKASSLSKLPPAVQRRFSPLTRWGPGRANLHVERTDTPRLTGIDASQIHPIGG